MIALEEEIHKKQKISGSRKVKGKLRIRKKRADIRKEKAENLRIQNKNQMRMVRANGKEIRNRLSA